MMMGCDTLLTVGSSFPYTQFMPAFGQARAVQIDVDPELIGMRYPYEVNLVGDAGHDAARADPAAGAQGATARWREDIESDGGPVVGDDARRGHGRGRPGQPDAAVRRAVRRCCPTTRSSPPTPGRRRTGTPAS